MRLLRTIAALSAALTPLMAEAAFSRPMPGTADFPRASNPQVNVPVCFIETPGGTTFDLVSLCGSNAAPQNTNPVAGNAPANNPNASTPPPPPNPNAITRDAVGTPITTPTGTANPNNPNNVNPGTSPAGTPNATPGTSPAGTPNNLTPGTSPTTNPNNLNPGTAPNTNPNNLNPGTAPNTNPNNLNPGTAPNTNPNNSASPTGGTAGDSNSDLVPNRNLNLPRVPPSSFGPGGVAPTRDAIDGPRQ
ncbi:hypothetical protein QUB19_08550 [Microcoleus sp. B4-C5]|uniref:hypothetical protein n=1 Tax=unclassified Microcoleus TaxID=2642155 RepID=UPI002FD0A23B